ncbi:hypothetical protein LJC25_00145 [Bacteroidales bacterium OttesenSCG-928-K03]|nr:hypothetical protein [Bacteroidales bacterium OttesenSCG-928-K03]
MRTISKYSKTCIFTLLMLTSFVVIAQNKKVIEKSDKHKPEWVSGVERGYLIVTAEAPDIEEAKGKILQILKSQIAETVATRIVSETTLHTSQEQNNGNFDFKESFENFINTKAANIPFISEISLSKAVDYYWEKLKDKSTGKTTYQYHVKYIFMEADIKDLVLAFQNYERELNEKLNSYTNKLNSIRRFEEIEETMNELRIFQKEFATDDPRFEKVDLLRNDYRNLSKKIIIEPVQVGKEYVITQLTLNNVVLSCNQIPKASSNCADKFEFKTSNKQLRIDFDDFNCYEDDDNYIEVKYKVGSENISKKIYIKL